MLIGSGRDFAGTRRLVYSDAKQQLRELIMRPNARGGPNLTVSPQVSSPATHPMIPRLPRLPT